MRRIGLEEIKTVIARASPGELIKCIEEAFVAMSDGTATVPPVGHLGFNSPPGDMHIKYGYISGDAYYVVKIASGFYKNQELGLPNNNGMMLVFNANTGEPECLLQDEGYLTDLRTALAGAVAAKYLAPKQVEGIGIVGTGVQARMQLDMLKYVTDCKKVFVYGRSATKVRQYQSDMTRQGYQVEICSNTQELAAQCNLIVTTTASQKPLLFVEDIRPGMHITAMGADTPGKQELDPGIMKNATIIACDSKSQCLEHGELSWAVKKDLINENSISELGTLISNNVRRSQDDLTVADLTGIATQDIKIASFTLEHLH